MKIEKDNILKAHKNGCDDVKKVLEDLFPDIIEEETYEIGDRFEHNDTEYILCFIAIDGKRHAGLIALDDGNYWHAFQEIETANSITQEEFNSICAGKSRQFKKL